ncbi:MAG: hypothetical protein JXR68_05380 [Bacteroidales bacterium]|nr:hypothetical protein [Bacteroidales bacterium]
MKRAFLFLVVISIFVSCNLLMSQKTSSILDTKYNGFYPVVMTGQKIYFYDDSTNFVFIDTNVIISVNEIELIKKQKNKTTNMVELYIELTPEGTIKFSDYTAQHIDEQLAIIFGDKLIVAPTIRTEILEGKIVLTTSYNDNSIAEVIDAFKQFKQ